MIHSVKSLFKPKNIALEYSLTLFIDLIKVNEYSSAMFFIVNIKYIHDVHWLKQGVHCNLNYRLNTTYVLYVLLPIDTGGSRGGVAGDATPLTFRKKIVFIRVAVVIDLVVTSSNNSCLCALNGVAV